MSTDNSGSTDLQSNSIVEEDQQMQQSQDDGKRPPTLQQNPASLSPLPKQPLAFDDQDTFSETFMNMALYDPPRWGWTAVGGIADVLTPHERSRRYSTRRAYKNKKRTRYQRKNGICGGATTKPAATETVLRLKDPPSYPTTASTSILKETISSEQPIVLERHQPSSSSCSEPLSSDVPTSQSISEITPQKPQNTDSQKSNSESKTTKDICETTILNTIASNEGSTAEGENSSSSRQEQQQPQDSTFDATDVKNRNLLDSDKTVQPNVKLKENIFEACVPSDKSVILPKQQPKTDIGLETTGMPTSVLGMTIQKQGQLQSATEANNDSKNQGDYTQNTECNKKINIPERKSKTYGKNKSRRSSGGVVPRTKYDCHIRSVGISSNSEMKDIDESNFDGDNDVVLDMYAYHQGREGMEPRDIETGELLITQQATDTNYDFDAPKSTFPIEIEFPLEDDDDDEIDNDYFQSGEPTNTKRLEDENENLDVSGKDNNNTTTASTAESVVGKLLKKKHIAMYRETLAWDLLDPNTPTPLAYALFIGKEYGLSFGQAMDLAARIDKQIQKHVTETSQYREPIAMKEPIQELTRSRKLGPIRQPYRFDEIVSSEKKGGTFKPKRESRGHTKPRSSSAFAGVAKKNKTGRSSASSETVTIKTSSSKRREKSKKNATNDTSGVSLEDELNGELLSEVRKRSSVEPVGQSGMVLKAEMNAICHICKKRTPIGYHFPCSMNNHVYCESHVKSRLGITKESGVYKHDSCPICTLACECAKCVRKLKNVATILKAKSIEQKKQPHEVDFPDILSACRNMIPVKELNRATDLVLETRLEEIRRKREEIARQQQPKSESLDKDPDKPSQQPQQKSDGKCLDKTPDKKSIDKKSRTILLAGQTMVPRPPLSDFPRELHNGIDFDTGATVPYFTAYSARGQQSVNDVPDAWLEDEKAEKSAPESSQLSKIKSTPEVQEDGNVDYCQICKTAGHLVLCDYCPRAFKQDCLKNDNRSSPDGDRWECFVCKSEKTPSDKDFVDGKESIDAIRSAFLEFDATDEHALIGLEVLSIIHQMLTNLIDYDFGYTFSKPVDISLVPGYKDIVKRPMDIGTICSKLVNGEFSKLLEGNFSMDDLLTKILNDIELIWRNCIMFNVIGSSVARMALVLRRRIKMICRRSIFAKLSDNVKENVTNYARKFDDSWASGMAASLSRGSDESLSNDSWKLSAIANLKPRSDMIFAAKATKGRPIAILDSVRGRVVKVYSSVKSASKAVEMILKSGHRCEWNASASRTDLNLKLIAEKSKNDPNSLLFGYRWLFLDDLNEGKVTFLKTVCDVIEMRCDEFTFVFRSIEEALSSFHLPKTIDINDLRNKLIDLPRDGNWAEIERVKWRRPMTPEKQRDSPKAKDSMVLSEEDVEFGANVISDIDSLPSWKNCAFLKKDLVTGQFLVGFDSIQRAFQDWVQSALSSPCFPSSEAQTKEHFKNYYLDGDRNVDGMIWQTVDNSHGIEHKGAKENTNNENWPHVKALEDSGNVQKNMFGSSGQGGNNTLSKSGESKKIAFVNESPSQLFNTIAMTKDEHVASADPSPSGKLDESQSGSGKRKYLDDDDDEIDFPPSKEARLSIVFVE